MSDTLWAPWRMEYILGEKEDGCIFCKALTTDDDLTLHKGHRTLVVMNKFPYINGHLLAAPVRHVAGLDDLEPDEARDLLITVDRSIAILKQVMAPEGFNVGMNLGKVAGAGIVDHLHIHLIPRWGGDTNFMTSVLSTRVLPESLAQTHGRLSARFGTLAP